MITLRPIAGMILGWMLLLAPGLARGQDNPWFVPPAGAPGYGGAQQGWQGGGGGAAWREPSYAPAWPQERSLPAQQCQQDAGWAPAPAPSRGQPRTSDAGGLNAVAALGASAVARGANRDWVHRDGANRDWGNRGWSQGEERSGAGYPPAATVPTLILGEFPPLDEDVTVQPPPRRDSRRSATASYGRPAHERAYEASTYAPPAYEPRGREEARSYSRREAAPGWNTYPPPLPPYPSTLGGGWGGAAGGYGTGGYGSYGYPYAGGYPAAYGWY